MIATPIPDDEILPGYVRRTLAPPPNLDDIDGPVRPADVQVANAEVGGVVCGVFLMRFVAGPGDVERLAAGQPLYLAVLGASQPPVGLHFLEDLR